MGQIITSLISFYLENHRTNKEYNTTRERIRISFFLKTVLIASSLIIIGQLFVHLFIKTEEILRLKEEIALLQECRKENETLKTRNEVLSNTISSIIGEKLLEQLNKDKKEYKK